MFCVPVAYGSTIARWPTSAAGEGGQSKPTSPKRSLWLFAVHTAPDLVPPEQCKPVQSPSIVQAMRVSVTQRWVLKAAPPELASGPVVVLTPHVDESGFEHPETARVRRLLVGAWPSCDW